MRIVNHSLMLSLKDVALRCAHDIINTTLNSNLTYTNDTRQSSTISPVRRSLNALNEAP